MRFLRTAILAIGVLGMTACGGSESGGDTTPAANPCAGGENPCAGGENPCAGGEAGEAGGEAGEAGGEAGEAGGENPCGGSN